MGMEDSERLKQLLSNTKALLEAMRYSISTPNGRYANIAKYSSYRDFLRKYMDLAKQALPLLPDTTLLDGIDIDKVKASGGIPWPQQKEYFDVAYSNLLLLKGLLEGAIGYAEDETQRLRDFVEANLRRAVFVIPDKEVDIQNAVEVLIVRAWYGEGRTL